LDFFRIIYYCIKRYLYLEEREHSKKN